MRYVQWLGLLSALVLLSADSEGKSLKIRYLLDENRRIPVDSFIYGDYNNRMLELAGEFPNLGFYDGGVWLSIDMEASQIEGDPTFLEIQNPNLDLILVYEIVNQKAFLHKVSGDQLNFDSKEWNHRYFQYRLKHQVSDIEHLLIYIDNIGDQLYIPMELTDRAEIDERDYMLQYINGLYFGILTFVLLLNLFMYFSLREKANIYYVCYIAGLFLLQLSLEGYGFELIWPESSYWANHANPIFATLSVLMLLFFCMEFLSLKSGLPRVNLIFKAMAAILVVNLILASINVLWAYKISILTINAIAFILNVMIIPVGIYLWIKGYKAARFFVVAFVVLVIGVFLFILRNFGLVPSNLFTEKALQAGSSLEVILLSLAIVDRFRIFKDQAYDRLQEINEIKSQINIELEKKVNERTKELKKQKEIVELKNEEITESIVYAKRIQNGLLPSDHLFDDLLPGSFYIYLPKDIVSGDFYWIDSADDKIYFAAVDCTGHGVPGAMVSVMGFNHLNRCIHEHGLRKPGEILDMLTKLMMGSFDKSELTIYDGMDIALCCLDRKRSVLEFAGANNPIYVVSNGNLFETKGTKQAIGYTESVEPFVNHEVKISSGDWIYLFSDGYADQFGGPKAKKFKYKNFKEAILEGSTEPAEIQREKLLETFHNWKENLDQLDDVCLLGIKI